MSAIINGLNPRAMATGMAKAGKIASNGIDPGPTAVKI